jgi:phage terminase large subunit GpA-like protein
MDAISDRRIEAVTVMKSARVGWTMVLNHTIGYTGSPRPMPGVAPRPAGVFNVNGGAPPLSPTPSF